MAWYVSVIFLCSCLCVLRYSPFLLRFSHELQALVDGRILMVTNMRETLILTPDMDKESTDGRTAMSTVETLIVSVFKCTVIHLCVEN